MDLSSLLPLIIGGFSSALGNQSANQQANQSAQVQQEQEAELQKIQDYELGLSQNTYQPIINNTILPAMLSRVNNGPFWAPDALKQAKGLEQDWNLNY